MGIAQRVKHRQTVVASLDIGSTKVACLIAQINAQDSIKVLGYGIQASAGIRQGIVTHLDHLQQTIGYAVHAAERMAGMPLREVYVNAAIGRTTTRTLSGHTTVDRGVVQAIHVQRAIDAAVGQEPREAAILHALPTQFHMDQISGVQQPLGMRGHRLGVDLNAFETPTMVLQNLRNCIHECHLGVSDIAATAYAAGLGVLTQDERNLGTLVIDMGGGLTNYALFVGDEMVHLGRVPLGGAHITSDIARGLSIPIAQAERLKTLHGSVIASTLDVHDTIQITPLGEERSGRNYVIPRARLDEIIRPRVEEILEYVMQQLSRTHLALCHSVVLTGGASLLSGMRDFAANFCHKPVRLGRPAQIEGGDDFLTSPNMAVACGLVRYSQLQQPWVEGHGTTVLQSQQGIMARVREMIERYF